MKNRRELKDLQLQGIRTAETAVMGEILAGVVHDLNQPLNVTKIICQSLLRDIEKERFEAADLKNELSEIVKQMDKMAGIIEGMRIFCRKNGITQTPKKELE